MIVDATFNESNSSFEPNVVEGGVTFSAKFSEGFGSNPDTGTGENGATFYPSVSAEGVLSWTNDKGLPNPDPVSINGKDGHSPVITIQNGYWYIDGKNTNVAAVGGKGDTGNGISSITKTNTEELIDTYTITFTDGTTTTYIVTNGKDGDKGDPYTLTEDDKSEIVQSVINALPKYNGEVVEL